MPETPKLLTVMVADDHPVVRAGMMTIIEQEPDMRVVAQAKDGEEAVALHRRYRPGVTLMDLKMPGMDGVQAIEEIRRETPGAKIVVMTTYDGDEDIYRALRAGARGYLLKSATAEEVTAGLRAVEAGSKHLSPDLAAKLLERMYNDALTERELEVLRLLVAGKTNGEIATTLFIADATVKFHLGNIFTKLGVTDRTQAVTTALRRGFVRLP